MRQQDIKKKWILIDGSGLVVGRLSSIIASILSGKHKPEYSPHMDCGDNVIVVNVDQVSFTGKKHVLKTYYRHTGYPGGIKSTTPKELHLRGYPERIIRYAVKGMLGKGPMARKRMKNLYLYNGSEHKHSAQCPIPQDILSCNAKNKVRSLRSSFIS